MSSPAIIVENLSKKFRIGTGGGPGYHRLSEAAAGIPRALYNSARNLFPQSSPRPASEPSALAAGSSPLPILNAQRSTLNSSPDFWALKDVSFEVQPGEVVGIIGRNGAGKSTLLKILSRITEPTSGRFGVRGRVASLLEVGTGFHPELTGRENIYVSGVTLGMTRGEIKKRFDEIVDFSGVEKFLDTPVKHYSSGMQVRLGFAVAAHLESEILIVDEVLAVGDAEFQSRCLGKMSSVASSGRTVLFVSHTLAAINLMCGRCVLLNNGSISFSGDTSLGIQRYLECGRLAPTRLSCAQHRSGTGDVRFTKILLAGNAGAGDVCSGEKLIIMLDLRFAKSAAGRDCHIAIVLSDSAGQRITCFDTTFQNYALRMEAGDVRLQCEVDRLPFVAGDYYVYLWASVDGQEADRVENAAVLTIKDGDFFGTGRLSLASKHGHTMVPHGFSYIRL